MADAKLTVEAQLDDVFKALNELKSKMQETGKGFESLGNKTTESVTKQSEKTQSGLEKMRSLGNRAIKSLMDDFKALANVSALAGGLKLSSQFSGSLKESVQLGDTIAKLGTRFGVAGSQFDSFKAKLAQGLGDIGASGDAAARALEGLAQTNVTNADSAIEYAKASAQLASIGRDQGREDAVAGGLGRIVQEAGFDPNDINKLSQLSSQVTKLVQASGLKTTEALSSLESTYSGLTPEQRKNFGFDKAAQVAISQRVTPEGSGFLKDYLSQTELERTAFDSQVKAATGGSLFDKQGNLDTTVLRSLGENIKGRGLDRISGAATITGDAQSGAALLKLIDRADDLDKSFSALKNASGDVTQVYRENMTLGEAFNANINKLKGGFAGLLDKFGLASPIDSARKALSDTSETTGGAALAVGGAAVGAAVLTNIGLKGIGGKLLGGLGGGILKEQAYEGLTGENIQPVKVMNWNEAQGVLGGLGGAGGGLLGGAGGAAGTALKFAGGALAAGTAGYAVGQALQSTEPVKQAGEFVVDKLISVLERFQGIDVNVSVDTKNPGITAEGKTQRGSAQ